MAGVVEDYVGYFAAIGVLSLSYVALRALYTLWGGFKSYVIVLGIDVKSLGEWAGMLLCFSGLLLSQRGHATRYLTPATPATPASYLK